MDISSVVTLLNSYGIDVQPLLCSIARSNKKKRVVKVWLEDNLITTPWYVCDYLIAIGKSDEASLYVSDVINQIGKKKLTLSTDPLAILICLSYFNKFKEIKKFLSSLVSIPFEDSLLLAFNYTGNSSFLPLIDKYILSGLPDEEKHLTEALILDNALVRYFSGVPEQELIEYAERKIMNGAPDFYSAILNSSLGYVYNVLNNTKKEKYISQAIEVITQKNQPPNVKAVMPLIAKNIYAYGNEHLAWRLFLRIIHEIEISSDVLSDIASISMGGLKVLSTLNNSESISEIRDLYFVKVVSLNLTYDAIDSLSRNSNFKSSRVIVPYLERLFEITNEVSFLLLALKFSLGITKDYFKKKLNMVTAELSKELKEETLENLFRILGEAYITYVSNNEIRMCIEESIEKLSHDFSSSKALMEKFVEGAYHESLKRYPLKKISYVL